MFNNPMSVIILVLIIAMVFLIIREVVTWYFKQNEIVNLLKKIDMNLEKIANKNLVSDKELEEENKYEKQMLL